MEYEGHKVITTNDYYDVYYPQHPKARENGSVMLHILVAEKMLGRNLTEQEVIHHIDGNRKNNNENNLMVFATQSDHISYHQMIKSKTKKDFILKQINGVYHCNYKNKHTVCRICSKPIYAYSKTGVCNSCYHTSTRKVIRPTRETLKSEIKHNSFVALGRKYGVSDKAITKWCKFYNLPYKSAIIKSISDEDWINI